MFAAKRKLKGHLYKTSCSSNDFTPTESVVWYWWHVINKAAFSNSLPYPSEIVVKKLRGAWGTCHCDTTFGKPWSIISISTDITDRKMFIATVAHEMVHQWQYHFGDGKLNHGSVFKDWNFYFKKNFGIIL